MNTNKFKTSARRVLLSSVVVPSLLAATPLTTMASSPISALQQETTHVVGTVVDNTGEPIIGASVKVLGGSAVGTVTDIDGNFTIDAPAGSMLEVTYVGFKAQTLKATPSVKVVLAEDSKALNEVVVVGFGTQKKANLTGAVSVVSSKEIAARPVQNAASALQGLIPGLQISTSSGTLDSNPSINVRGTGTIGQGTSGSPLILIDGAEGDINTLNSQDIESVSVLKDAAASSIYGSRAPFGVILITTKKGKQGKVSINYNNSFRFSGMIRGKHMMNSVDFASWMNDLSSADGGSAQFSNEQMERIVAYHNATPVSPGVRRAADGTLLYAIEPNTGNPQYWADGYATGCDDVDYYDAIFKKSSFSMEHNASVSGASDKVNYYASFNYLDNEGFMKLSDDNYKRYNAAAKLGIKLTSWLDMDYSTRFTRTDFLRPADLKDQLYSDLARQGWPTLPLYDRNGYYYSSPSPALDLAQGGKDKTQRNIFTNQFKLTLEPIKNWKTHLDFTYRTDYTDNHYDTQTTYNHDVNGQPYVNTANGTSEANAEVHESTKRQNYFNFQAYTEYNLSLAQKHNFHLMTGFQAEQLKQRYFEVTRTGIIDPAHPEIDITTGLGYDGKEVAATMKGNRDQWQTAGFFGRLNYNYDERYLLEANIRRDGSSRFRRDQMWRTFPSVSLGWNIAGEKFFESLTNTVNQLKLRASYGSLGNQNTDDWYRTYSVLTYNPNDGKWLQNGTKPSTVTAPVLVSPTLTWEKIESYDIGLDLALLNNRLTASFDWFVRNTKDMVGNAPELPAILGADVPVTNNTDLRTTGWEMQISWRDALKNGLHYGVTFNLSDARTKITRYPNNPTNSVDTYIAGRYINEIWGYETVGIAKTNAQMQDHLAKADQTALGSNWAAGDIMYRDLDNNGVVNDGSRTLADHGDLKVMGNSTPRFLAGLDLTASWHGFDFRAFFQGVLKRDFAITSDWGGREWLFGCSGSGRWWASGITAVHDYFRNEDSWSVKNGYQSANTDSWLPRPVENGGTKNTQVQSRYLLNAAYVRLKNLQLGYTIPSAITQKWGVSNLRVFFSAENLFTITSMPSQFDPELISTKTSGVNAYPLSRTFAFGVNVSF